LRRVPRLLSKVDQEAIERWNLALLSVPLLYSSKIVGLGRVSAFCVFLWLRLLLGGASPLNSSVVFRLPSVGIKDM
jgi:hypothetical protein